MNKKADVGISLKFIIGLVIAIMFIIVLMNVSDKFILFGKNREDSQKVYFEKLNSEIENLGINQKTTQLFVLDEKYLLISFNNKDSVIKENLEGTVYDTIKDITIKKPAQYKVALCLCKTKNSKYLFEDDCLQADDICTEYEKEITNNGIPFKIFGRENYNLVVEKTFDKINIKNE